MEWNFLVYFLCQQVVKYHSIFQYTLGPQTNKHDILALQNVLLTTNMNLKNMVSKKKPDSKEYTLDIKTLCI